MADLVIEPTGATLGAIVRGVSLARIDDATWRRVHAAFLDHALLIFPGQHLEAEEQLALGRRLGEIEHIVGDTGYVAISNQRPDGSVIGDDHPATRIMKGNEGWHTDSSYMDLAAKASVLAAVVVPPDGGGTEWADMRAAFDALDDATRERVGGLAAHHSIRWSQARAGLDDPAEEGFYGFDDREAPLRPLVKVHPETGRPALFIGRHAHAIPGLDPDESLALLDHLVEWACRPPRTYEHRWEPGDVAMWDNRCVLHRARPFDRREPRIMRHVRVAGDPATELALGLTA